MNTRNKHAIRFVSFHCLIGCFLAFVPLLTIAQTAADSLRIVTATWKEKTLETGAVWKQVHFDDLFESQQEVNLLEIDLSNPDRKVAFAGLSNGMELTSVFAKEAGALGAINATFFDTKNGGATTFVRIDGQIVNETSMIQPDGTNHERANGAIVANGQAVSIVLGDNQATGWDKQLAGANVMVCGPTLLQHGTPVTLQKNAFNDNRHPRSAAAITADNKLILLTVDGRNANAHGMNLHELAFLLRVMGMQDALNLDGGGSTTLYVKGESDAGVVNYPSDNKAFDHGGERKVANAVLVY